MGLVTSASATPRVDELDSHFDRGDGRGRVGSIGRTQSSSNFAPQTDDRQRARKKRQRLGRVRHLDGDIQAEAPRNVHEMIGLGDDEKDGRRGVRVQGRPGLQRQFRADTGRITARQRHKAARRRHQCLTMTA